MQVSTYERIEAVVKLTERCNIDCSYCYMFNKSSDLYLRKPKQISISCAENIARFLLHAAKSKGTKSVRIIMHGGEPLMLNKEVFRGICDTFYRVLSEEVTVKFALQTNAILVNDDWISLFSRYQVSVGVSLDGPEHLNDLERVDHNGQGTYTKTVEGTRKLQESALQGDIPYPALLCVIDPRHDGGEIFRHFVDDLNFYSLDFLLPIETYDTASRSVVEGVGTYLVSVLDSWLEHEDQERIFLRFFDSFYQFVTGKNRITGEEVRGSNTLILTFATDGTFGPDDTLRILGDELFDFDSRETTIDEYLSKSSIRRIEVANKVAPKACTDCSWVGYCRGGAANGRVINRYQSETGFDNKSLLCPSLREIYTRVASSLLEGGADKQRLVRLLERSAESALGAGKFS